MNLKESNRVYRRVWKKKKEGGNDLIKNIKEIIENKNQAFFSYDPSFSVQIYSCLGDFSIPLICYYDRGNL